MSNTQRITISMPDNIYKLLTAIVSRGKISPFITKAVEDRLIEEIVNDPVKEFLNLRKAFPKTSGKKIISAIEKGRV